MSRPVLRSTAAALAAVVAFGGAANAQASTATDSTSTVSSAPASGILSAFTIVAPRSASASELVARAVIPAGVACPDLTVTDGLGSTRAIAMVERKAAPTTAPAFAAITVCSAAVPVGAVTARVAGHGIPAALPAKVHRMALFGDSGCRVDGAWVQDCSAPDQWPLARIATSIAQSKPDVVIFTGDFFYRETTCPDPDEGECGTSPPPLGGAPFTDSAYGWLADVLLPMSGLLPTVPIVATRGNHEACNRAGNGFFLLFDPRPDTTLACAPTSVDGVLTAPTAAPTGTYAVDLPIDTGRTLRLAIVDSSGGNDTQVTHYAQAQRPAYQAAAQLTRRAPGRESWLVTHRPLYGFFSTLLATPGQPFSPWWSADQGAAAWGLLDTYSMVLSSHLHQAQSVQLPGLPGQLVIGNGGTYLNPVVGYPLPTTGASAGPGQTYPAPTQAWNETRFGYAIAEPQSDAGAWTIWMRAPDGRDFGRCGLRPGSLYCRTLN